MDLDRQTIERRDFPIVRRGYDPASVDAHLRALAADVEELQSEASRSGRESLASTAGTQVQGILEAAQATAETIEREAAQTAQRVREGANEDALRTREEAVTRAREYVAAVSKTTEALLARVGSLDTETHTLVESLRSGASRLVGDLTEVETEMGALYDAAAGRIAGAGEGAEAAASQNGVARESVASTPIAAASAESRVQPTELDAELGTALPREVAPESAPVRDDPAGARLVALNMALNGDSREDTGQYLSQNFDVPDRERLLDEVYMAIEG
ncbi:MAG TPA: DivIVA domain-containing protein [Solirubrobacteraceae bacterium]|nr:DivIVA domain-containing protein [Solirubrobacteraceae bacterium]